MAPGRVVERDDDVVGEAENLGRLADRRARAIGRHRRGQAGALAAVARVDVLDHLLAPFVLEIDVDVGRLVALGRDEALEQKIEASAGSTSVIPRQKQTVELAAEPRPWQRMPRERAKRTMSCTVRK